MRQSSYKDKPDSNDRKTVRRIFLQMLGVYMALVVTVVASVATKSVFAAWLESGFSKKVDLR